ncbi:MAG: LytTR family transcriptional regulator [Desulfobacterales bacterium]|nr:LytTR family transcriptional regulator [Desulfobacterales bacterium]
MLEIISTISAWFNRPFPHTDSELAKVGVSILFGIFIFLFLAFFQPFGIESIARNKTLYLSGFGVITFVGMMINFYVLPVFFPSFFDLDKWCVKNHIIFCLGNILLIVFLNWIYDNQVEHYVSKNHGLLSFLVYTLGVGIIPTILVTMFLERSFWKKHSLIAQDVSEKIENQKFEYENEQLISLFTENKNGSLELSQNSLICISSEGNYSKVYYLDQEKVSEKLMRMPLKAAEEHLTDFDKIVRCHRSHIVNLQLIESVSGNARSFKLHMRKLDVSIPVSRSFPKTIIEQLKIELPEI